MCKEMETSLSALVRVERRVRHPAYKVCRPTL